MTLSSIHECNLPGLEHVICCLADSHRCFQIENKPSRIYVRIVQKLVILDCLKIVIVGREVNTRTHSRNHRSELSFVTPTFRLCSEIDTASEPYPSYCLSPSNWRRQCAPFQPRSAETRQAVEILACL